MIEKSNITLSLRLGLMLFSVGMIDRRIRLNWRDVQHVKDMVASTYHARIEVNVHTHAPTW